MRRLLWAAGLLLLACAGARAEDGWSRLGFSAPALDGVAPGLRRGDADPNLIPYLFAGGQDWPALRLRAARPLDWSGAAALVLPVDNPGAQPFTLVLRLDDRPDANGDDRSLTGTVTIPPATTAAVVLPLGPSPAGLRGRPPGRVAAEPGDLPVTEAQGAVAANHIVALHVSGVRGPAERTLLIGTPALRAARPGTTATPGPLVDRYGQALTGTWPEKVSSDAELRERVAAAAAQTRRLAAGQPAPTGRFGGLTDAPVQRATGAFRVARIGSRWSFVTPDGRPFLSLGVDAVQPRNLTLVEGRTALFEGLPGRNTDLGSFYRDDEGRDAFDIGGANLFRGLGADWARRWPAQTVARLGAWGFNTLGAWSDPALGPALPHVTFWDVEGGSASVPMGSRTLPDPFDPAFPAVADRVTAAMAAAFRDDPGLIGYFSGNELPWGEAGHEADGLTAHVLAAPPGSPARQALLEELRARYGTADRLALAWNLPPGRSWEGPLAWPATPTAAALADSRGFEARYAARYFGTVAAALKRHDPNHLYLGTRFASATPAAVQACARFCDVLSFNIYGRTPAERAALWRGLDRPVLIGEFHFGSLDRGSFWAGMVGVGSEAERGPAYRGYLEAAVADPAIVGVHWYQYADEPLTGRPYDGENGHLGLVAVTDVPFGGFVEAVAAANRDATATFARQLATPASR